MLYCIKGLLDETASALIQSLIVSYHEKSGFQGFVLHVITYCAPSFYLGYYYFRHAPKYRLIRTMLNIRGKKSKDLAVHMDMAPQAMRNKFNRGSFTAEDLIKISTFLNAELSFKFSDSQRIVLEEDDIRE